MLDLDIQDFHGDSHVSIAADWAATRQRMLFVAKQHFARCGFQTGSLAELAKMAELPEAEVLKHFRTKLDLLLAIFEDGWSVINPKVSEIIMSAANAKEATVSIVTVVLHMLEKDPALTHLMLVEGRRVDPATGAIRISRGYEHFMQMCEDLIVRGQKDGSFKVALQPTLIATALFGAIEGLLQARLLAAQKGESNKFPLPQILATFDALVSQYRA